MSLLKKLAGETALYGLSSIAARLLSFVFLTPYLTRTFSRSEFGLQTELYAWAAFFMVLYSFRMETTFFRFGNKIEKRDDAFWTASTAVWGSTLLITTLLLLFSENIAIALQYPDKGNYVRWFAIILAADALVAIPFARLRLEGRAMRFASLKILNILLHLGSLLFFLELCPWLAGRGYTWVDAIYDPSIGIGYLFIANLVASLATALLLLPMYFKKSGRFDQQALRKMLRYAAPLAIAGFAGIINEVVDRNLLKWLLPGTLEERLAGLGVYSACYKIAIILNLFTQAFNYAAEPFFFKHSASKSSPKLYARVAEAYLVVGCFAFLGIVLYIDIVKYFVGADFREGLKVVPVLLLANLCLGMYYNLSIWYKITDKTIMGAYIALIGAGITIGTNLVLIPWLGYLGAAWATLACYATMMVLSYFWGRRYYKIPYPIERFAIYAAVAIGLYVMHIPLRDWVGKGTWALFAINLVFLWAFFALVLRWRKYWWKAGASD